MLWMERPFQVEAAKKDPKQKRLSDNIQNFLRKQDEERRRSEESEKRKMQHLLELRANSKDAQKYIKRALTMTKSANRAVIEDARNDRDTAATLAGRNQCDEDDYGYESNMASNLYNKLMNMYEECPGEDPMAKFSNSGRARPAKDLSSTVARVKERLLQGDQDDRRQNSSSAGSSRQKQSRKGSRDDLEADDFIDDDDDDVEYRRQQQQHPDKKRAGPGANPKKAPPPEAPSFSELMKLAAERHGGNSSKAPGDRNPATKAPKENASSSGEPSRPMTKKQRQEYLREKASHLRKKAGKSVAVTSNAATVDVAKNKKSLNMTTGNNNNSISINNKSSSGVTASSSRKPDVPTKAATKSQPSSTLGPSKVNGKGQAVGPQSAQPDLKKKAAPQPSSSVSHSKPLPRSPSIGSKNLQDRPRASPPLQDRPRSSPLVKDRPRPSPSPAKLPNSASAGTKSTNASSVANGQQPRPPPPPRPSATGKRPSSPSTARTTSGKDPSSSSARPLPLNAGKGSPEKRPLKRDWNSVQSRPFPGELKQAGGSDKSGGRKKSAVGHPGGRVPSYGGGGGTGGHSRMRIESDDNDDDDDEDEDSEMDDFIDDSEANVDISAQIRSIFGYDRRKFRNEEDFDDRSMECNRFSDVMKEEARSAKIGRMEDLEDMRREEEEKRRKAMKAKMKNRR